MEFSIRLNSIFDELGMPQRGRATTLQKLTGVTNTGTQKWLNGLSIPRRKYIKIICKKYKKKSEWLEYGELHKTESAVQYSRLNIDEDGEYCDIYFWSPEDNEGIDRSMEAITFRKSYLQKLGLDPHDACLILAPDSRMEPSISKGDDMLVDRSKRNPEDERGIYVIRIAGYNRVNLVTKNIDGSITLVSENDDPSYPNEVISLDTLKTLEIVGKVRWSGGSK